jgi:hypothetical protein
MYFESSSSIAIEVVFLWSEGFPAAVPRKETFIVKELFFPVIVF